MADTLFKKMPLGLVIAYEDAAEMQEETAKSEKRAADAQTLRVLADALKEHGSKKQYAASQEALAAFFKRTVDELHLEIGDSRNSE